MRGCQMTGRKEELDSSEADAQEMFNKFHARSSKRRVTMDFGWPKKVQKVGSAEAQMYRSNKWKMNARDYEDYKHIAEGHQSCYVVPGFLKDFETGKNLKVHGSKENLSGPMPKFFTVLAPLIGIQLRLYNSSGRLPKGENNLYEVRVDRGFLGGAKCVQTGATFLIVYTKAGGIGMIITGDELDIEKDGIVG